MNQKPSILSRILPFFLAIVTLGVTVGLFVLGFIIFSWFLLIVALIACVVFLVGYVRLKFSRFTHKSGNDAKKSRVIDHEK